MAPSMKETGRKISFVGEELTHGLMGESMTGSGRIISFMDLVSTHGLMANVIQDNTWMILSMVMESIPGQTESAMMGAGKMVSNMAKPVSLIAKERPKLEYGKTEKESNG